MADSRTAFATTLRSAIKISCLCLRLVFVSVCAWFSLRYVPQSPRQRRRNAIGCPWACLRHFVFSLLVCRKKNWETAIVSSSYCTDWVKKTMTRR